MSDTLGEDLSIVYCCRRPKFTARTLLCNTEYFYVLLTVTSCSAIHTERIAAFRLQTVVMRPRRSMKLYVLYLWCFNVRIVTSPSWLLFLGWVNATPVAPITGTTLRV
jgi:hypothetical protein